MTIATAHILSLAPHYPPPPLPPPHGVVLTEFTKIAGATSIGFLIMGFIGFFVKLIHIPINNIIVGA